MLRSRFILRSLAFSLVLSSSVFFAPKAHAGYWGEAYLAVLLEQSLETIARNIESTVLGTLKVAAVQVLNNQVNQLVGGTSIGNSLIITNYEDFLYRAPEQQARTYVNDLLSLRILRGQYSSANYVPASGLSGVGGNYQSYLRETALNATVNRALPRYDLNEYTSDPAAMFAEGDLRAINAWATNAANNPYGIALVAQEQYQSELARQQRVAEGSAQSSGLRPVTDEQGNIIAPAASVEELVTSVQSLGQEIIVAADSPGQLLSGVVVGLVNQTVNNLVRKGIGDVQQSIDRELGGVTRQVNGALRDAQGALGPAAPLINETLRQRTQTGSTTAPPPLPPDFQDGIY